VQNQETLCVWLKKRIAVDSLKQTLLSTYQDKEHPRKSLASQSTPTTFLKNHDASSLDLRAVAAPAEPADQPTQSQAGLG
jgi:hypothetical protein